MSRLACQQQFRKAERSNSTARRKGRIACPLESRSPAKAHIWISSIFLVTEGEAAGLHEN